MNNLASQLFEHGRITTTETRANSVQPLAEKLISKAKRGDIASRRLVLRRVTDKSVVHEFLTEIAPKMAGRDGGYTRITKIGPRKGDNASMVVLELVLEEVKPKSKAKKVAPKPVEAPKVEAAPADEVPAEKPVVVEESVCGRQQSRTTPPRPTPRPDRRRAPARGWVPHGTPPVQGFAVVQVPVGPSGLLESLPRTDGEP